MLLEIYFSVYILYPTITALTFFGDRLAFVIIASPILVSLLLPETYYKDNQYELRSSGGLLAPTKIILIEKEWFTEKQIAQTNSNELEGLDVQEMEIVIQTQEYLFVSINYQSGGVVVKFKKYR